MIKNKYILFLAKSAVLLGIVFLVDFLAGLVLEHFYPKMKAGEYSRITYAIDKSKDQMLIFGSSKANHHYIPTVFENGLKKTTYNAGIDGQSIFYHYTVLKCVQARYNPEIILLDLHIDEFNKFEDSYTRLSALFPYYKRRPEVRPVIKMRGPYERFKIISNLYRYNSLAITIAKNNIAPSKDITQNGYYPLYGELKHSLAEEPVKKGIEIDSLKVNYFEKFIEDATKAGSKVYVVVSPMFRIRKDESETLKIAREICRKSNVSLMDFSQDPLYLAHPDYFQDASHLNNNGAKVYSEMILSKIQHQNN